jgi:hypothetical protein
VIIPVADVLNRWTHWAFIRNGSTYTVYVDGISKVTGTSASQISQATNVFTLGTTGLNAYFSGFRFVKGQALSTGNFTPPTAPVTANTVAWTGANVATSLTGTVNLLLNFTDTAARDSTGRLVLETVGDSKVSVVQKKYGTGAMYFDGTGDGIVCPNPTLFNFGSGDLTIECWFNYNSGTTNYGLFTTRLNAGQYAPVQIQLETGNVLKAYASTSGSSWAVNITSSTSPVAGTWYHVALVRSGTTFTLYLNGYNVGTTTGISGALATSTLYGGVIGVQSADLTNPMNGYIDDLRVTRYARYTGSSTSTPNFTPPAQTFKLR